MSKFKVGDKVRRIISDYDDRMIIGREGIVTAVGSRDCIYVDDHTNCGDTTPYNGCYFELVEPYINTEAILDNMEKQDIEQSQPSKTGGSTPNQYRLSVNLPLTSDRTQFVDVDLEAMDVIDALDLSGNLKDVQKALFRMGKKQETPVAYDLNKCLFYILREMKKREIVSHAKFWEVSSMLEKMLNDN